MGFGYLKGRRARVDGFLREGFPRNIIRSSTQYHHHLARHSDVLITHDLIDYIQLSVSAHLH